MQRTRPPGFYEEHFAEHKTLGDGFTLFRRIHSLPQHMPRSLLEEYAQR